MRRHWIVPYLVPALFLGAWEAAVRLSLLSSLFFPAPSELLSTFADMIMSGEMARRMAYTLTRAMTGFLNGSVLGILCGVVMGVSPLVRRALDPFVSALYSTPKLTLLPMLMLIAAVNYGASPSLLFRRVYLPSSAPHVFTGLRLGVGRAVVLAISLELLVGGSGLGNMVRTAWLAFLPERIYAAVILCALLGLSVNEGLKKAEAHLVPWKAR